MKRNKLFVSTVAVFMLLLTVVTFVSLKLLREQANARVMEENAHKMQAEIQQAMLQKDISDKQAAEAERKRLDAERAKDAALNTASEIMSQFRGTREERSRLITAGVMAAISKDPSIVAGFLDDIANKAKGSTSSPASQPNR